MNSSVYRPRRFHPGRSALVAEPDPLGSRRVPAQAADTARRKFTGHSSHCVDLHRGRHRARLVARPRLVHEGAANDGRCAKEICPSRQIRESPR